MPAFFLGAYFIVIEDINLLKFKTESKNCYIFDGITNNIYQVSPEDFDRISNVDLGRENGIRNINYNHSESGNDIASNAKTLIIELTEKCNLRCSYCVYDENIENNERSHGKDKITLETAIKSVDDFYKRTNKDRAFIVFYGGEPLLEFETIKKIVEYSNKISSGKIKFSLTTNGTMFNKDSIEFLVKNDFLLTISIDGPKHINDNYRFKNNKKGVFEKIIEDLVFIKAKYADYYSRQVIFNCVINNIDDIDEINSFFIESNVIDYKKVRFSAELSKSNELNTHISNIASSHLLADYGINELRRRPIENSFLGILIDKINYRKLGVDAHKGKKVCIPFSNRTFVRANGNIQFCERIQNYAVVENSELKYLEKESIRIQEEFNSFKKDECSKCFAYNFCEFCPASFIVNGNFNKQSSKDKCEAFRVDIKRSLASYIECKDRDLSNA